MLSRNKLDTHLKDMNRFLAANPREVVVLLVNDDTRDRDYEVVGKPVEPTEID
jgi:agmatine/peptidylarginine deiminase